MRGSHVSTSSRQLSLPFVVLVVMVAGLMVVTSATPGGTRQQGNCASRVAAYLRHVVTHRAEVAQREVRARANLNEARSVAVEEEDEQRHPRNDTQQRIRAAADELEVVHGIIERFDKDAFKEHGDVPCVCVKEVFAGSNVMVGTVTATWTEELLLQVDILRMYCKLYWETLFGTLLFTREEYASYEKLFGDLKGQYQKKVDELWIELERGKSLSPGEEGNSFLEYGYVALTYAKIWTYGAVPWATQITVFILVVMFLPFVISATVLSNFVWRLWLQLFVVHHVYGLTAHGIPQLMRELVDAAAGHRWGELQSNATTAFLRLAYTGGCGTLFSLLPALMLILGTVTVMVVFMCLWAKLPLALLYLGGETETEQTVKRVPASTPVKGPTKKGTESGKLKKVTPPPKGNRNKKETLETVPPSTSRRTKQ